MEDEEVFSILSKCFSTVSEKEWNSIVSSSVWSRFLDGVRRLIQDDRALGVQSGVIQRVATRCPLHDFISYEEVSALFDPPSYSEKQAFFSRYFVGGLAQSAVPVESLYVSLTGQNGAGDTRSQSQTGFYRSDSAFYMESLVDRLGLNVPEEYQSTPDHLALELDLMAVLLRSGLREQASLFLQERFEWLTDFRLELLGVGKEARFYTGLIDVLMGIRAQQSVVLDCD